MKSLLPGGLSMPKTQPAGKDPVQMIIEGGSGSSQQLVRLIDSESRCGSDCKKKKKFKFNEVQIDGIVDK